MKGCTVLRSWVAVAVVLAGCADSRPSAQPFSVRDSAGVEIAESRAPAWPSDAGWRVRGEPSVQIGAVEGAPDQQLYRVFGARRLSDGRIVVASDGSMQLRFYSPRGEFLNSSGREGEGPGEFRTLMPLLPFRGDSLLAFDYRLRRLSVWDARGRFGRSMPVSVGGNYWPSGTLSDSLVLLASPGESGFSREVPGVYWDSTSFFLYRGANAPIDTIARYRLSERLGRSGGAQRSYHFGLRARWATAGDRYYLGWGECYEVGEYARDGRLLRLIRRSFEPPAATPEVIDAFQAAYVSLIARSSGPHSTPEDLERLGRRLEEAEYRSHLPAYSDMRVDPDGYLWVEDYRYPGQEESTWSVFAPTGRWLGEVEMPSGLHVHQIGTDFVLGSWQDEMGVEYVRLHALERIEAGDEGARPAPARGAGRAAR